MSEIFSAASPVKAYTLIFFKLSLPDTNGLKLKGLEEKILIPVILAFGKSNKTL